MVQVSKKTVSQWLLLSLLAEQRILQQKLASFASKYNSKLAEFEARQQEADGEVFGEWEDYIEWKSVETALREIQDQIEDVKNGAIRLVD